MSVAPLKVLTHSRMACSKSCRRRHLFRYLLGIRREQIDEKLSFGSSVHEGLDFRAMGSPQEEVCELLRGKYDITPGWIVSQDAADDWLLQCEKVLRMLCGYDWMWENDGYKVIATEQQFILPIRNPATGRASRTFLIAGKIDKIIELPDGRLAIMEHKTTGDSIDADARYWKRLRHDHQITEYLWAARQLGYDVQTIMYDVIRRPVGNGIQVPLLDGDDVKIVLNAKGDRVKNQSGKWRQSGDKSEGWALQNRRETSQEYGERLTKAIGDDPNAYFHRREIPRTPDDIAEWLEELWAQAIDMREAEKSGSHYRNPDNCIAPYKCEYLEHCHSHMTPNGVLADGFIQTDNIHPELELDNDKAVTTQATAVKTVAVDDSDASQAEDGTQARVVTHAGKGRAF